jgi:hypothetical protein
MRTLRLAAAAVAALALAGCEENAVQDITAPVTGGAVKFFHFGVGGPGVHFFHGDTKATAILSATGVESVTGNTFGNAGNAGLYVVVPTGPRPLSARIAATVDNGLAIATVNATIDEGKRYSFYLAGTYNAVARTQDAFVIEDVLPATIDPGQAYVRFVHAIANANPMTLFGTNTSATAPAEAAIGTETAYRAGSTFVAVPPGVYNLLTRYTGSATTVIARTGVSFNGGRVYTITARGDITVTSTTLATRPQLDNTANR